MSMAGEEFSSQDQIQDALWPDLYALLGVAPEVSVEMLRTRIREAFMEATRNTDHRNIERRAYYKRMGQRIVPQARRILMEERTRRAYDEQLALHRAGDASAIPFDEFIANLAAIEAGSAPTNNTANTPRKSSKPFDPQAERAIRNQRVLNANDTAFIEKSPSKKSSGESSTQFNDSAGENAVLNSEEMASSGADSNARNVRPREDETPDINALSSSSDVAPNSVKLPYTRAADAIRAEDTPRNAAQNGAVSNEVPDDDKAPRKTETLWDKVPRQPNSASAPASDSAEKTNDETVADDTSRGTNTSAKDAEAKGANATNREEIVANSDATFAANQTSANAGIANAGSASANAEAVKNSEAEISNRGRSADEEFSGDATKSSTRNVESPRENAEIRRGAPTESGEEIANVASVSANAVSSDIAPNIVARAENSEDKSSIAANFDSANTVSANASGADEIPILQRAPTVEEIEVQLEADAESARVREAEIAAKTFIDEGAEFPPSSVQPCVTMLPIEENPVENEARRARVLRVERGARPLTSKQLDATSGQDLGDGFRGVVTAGRAKNVTNFKSRVQLSAEDGEAASRGPNESRGRTQSAKNRNSTKRGVDLLKKKRVLSQPVLYALTAFTSAALVFLILQTRRGSMSEVPSGPVLRLVYSSDLQGFMEEAQRQFHANAVGRGVNLDLRPADSRDAMHLALGVATDAASNATSSTRSSENDAQTPSQIAPDVWIPGETLWSDRYNQVAAKFRQRPIGVARSMAVSPLVLIARADKAAALKRQFPNHVITSWDALQRAIGTDAAGHFGLSDPQKSGSGALARSFMAREWCERAKMPWDKKSASDARLWKWMSVFEDNVPEYATLTGDMIKELAVGNADRYWWAIGYESDALGWMRRGQKVQIFYLPRTALAEHPFCYLERDGFTPAQSRARSAFETFLRGRAMQTQLLKNGFRPTEIALDSVADNPFKNASFRALGLRANGFRVDSRLNYDTLNALNVQWKIRYSG